MVPSTQGRLSVDTLSRHSGRKPSGDIEESHSTNLEASPEDGARVPKKPHACVSCHQRKVKCDAVEIGLPCTRCITKDKTATCEFLVLSERRSKKSQKRSQPAHDPLAEDERPSRRARHDLEVEVSKQQLCRNCSHKIRSLESELMPIGAGKFSSLDYQNSLVGEPETILIEQQDNSVTPLDQVNGTEDEQPVIEEDAHLQICREMSHWGSDSMSPTQFAHPRKGREVIEYHDGTNSVTILSEVFGRERPRKLVRIVLEDLPIAQQGTQNRIGSEAGLDDADIDYLRRKRALAVPEPVFCDELLQIYFNHVYPYAPIFNREEFLQSYEAGKPSIFLLQAIFAHVVPYISAQLLQNIGFTDRLVAQKTFFAKAKILYYLGRETGQLQLLQGSIILSTMAMSYAPDNDYRFWLVNAVRIATQMGLHKKSLARNLDASSAALLRRIWWVVYNRDILLAVSGLENVRRLHDDDCDTAELTEDDWEEENLPIRFQALIPAQSRIQKQYLVENGKLSKLSGQFIKLFRTPGKEPSRTAIEDLERALYNWRQNLPPSFQASTLRQRTPDNVWILVLLVESYRTECLFYRALRENHQKGSLEASQAAQMYEGAIFELHALIERINALEIVQFCPLSVATCVSTLLAMHVETAMNAANNPAQKIVAKMRIHVGLTYLRASCRYWRGVKWFLRIFEVIAAHMSLSLEDGESGESVGPESGIRVNPMNPFSSNKYPTGVRDGRSAMNSSSSNGLDFTSGGLDIDLDGAYYTGLGEGNDDGFTGGKSAEVWLQELLGGDLAGFEDSFTSNAGVGVP